MRIKGSYAAIAALAASLAFADGGGISFKPEVKLFEPGQKAIVGFNGETETMILSIDVRATGETKALEVVPLPSEPTLEKGDPMPFLYADYLVDQACRSLVSAMRDREDMAMGAADRNEQEKPAIEVTTHKRIGPHDITAIKVNNYNGMATWLAEFFEKQGVKRELPKELERILNAYLEHGVQHFALDVMDLSNETRTIDPIVYTFKTDKLWYPMQISGLYEGETDVTLITVTEKPIQADRMPGGFAPLKITIENTKERGRKEIDLPAIQLVPERAKKLSAHVHKLFDQKETVLQVWRYKGTLRADFDVAVKP